MTTENTIPEGFKPLLAGTEGTIPNGFRPLLAIELTKVKTKASLLYGSPKLDGIRAIIFGGTAYSRSLKPIPNQWIQEWAMDFKEDLEGVDGEFIVGPPNAEDTFNVTTSAVMRKDGKPDFCFYAFDVWHAEKTYFERLLDLQEVVDQEIPRLLPVSNYVLEDEESIVAFEKRSLEDGFEGIMLRDPEGTYKHGRSGTKNPQLIKVKRFVDAEFEVVGFECEYQNANAAKTNELGRTERSTSKEGMLAKESLGVLYLKYNTGETFGCGSGFSKDDREKLWKERDTLVGKMAKVKYFEVGLKDLPRFPVFLGFRAEEDISE